MPNNAVCKIIAVPVIFIGTVIFVFTIAVVMFGQNKYFSASNTFRRAFKGDQIIISKHVDDYSTTWCSIYNVNPWDYASIFLLPMMPNMDPHERQITNINIQRSMMARNVYDERGAFMFSGSHISFQSCREINTTVAVDVMIIKGSGSYNRWIKNQYSCPDCAVLTKSINGSFVCSLGGKRDLIEYNVECNDVYHIVVSRRYQKDESESAYLTYDIILNRTVYDISNPIESCLDTRDTCSLNLTGHTDAQIILYFDEDERLGGSLHYTNECKANIIMWLGVFGLLPLGLIICAISYILFTVCNKNRHHGYITHKF